MALNSLQSLPFHCLNDNEFMHIIFEQQHGPIHFDSDRLASLKYNPLIMDLHKYRHLTLTNDPDSNFNVGSNSCNYFVGDEFNEMMKNNVNNKNHLSLLHLNIRSLNANLEKLTYLLSNLNSEFSVIGITETWLQNTAHLVDIENYSFVHKHRTSPGGGVGLYLSKQLNFKMRLDLCSDRTETMESLFIEICNPNGKNIIVGVIYRPPNMDVNLFLNTFNETLGKISKENKICHLMGDFNLNLMNYQNHTVTGNFLDGLYSNAFVPMITCPTKITSHTATLIDNIFTNHYFESASGLLLTDISDHLPIFSICLMDPSYKDRNETILVRDKCPNNKIRFKEQLMNNSWFQLEGINDPKTAYKTFFNKFSEIYNNCFPFKKIRIRCGFRSKPWLSNGLLNSIKKKNKLYKKFLQNPTPQSVTFYKTYKNKLNHSLRISKRLYYEKKLENCKSNNRATWKLLNEIICKKKAKVIQTSAFKADNLEIFDPEEIANRFCNYFTNIGPNLARKIQPSTVSHMDFLNDSFINSIFLSPIDEGKL